MYLGTTFLPQFPGLEVLPGWYQTFPCSPWEGPIASRWDETERATSISLTADDLVRSLPGTGPDIVVQAHSFRLCPSGDLSTADIVALARAITSAATGGADGVVVAQGTNTLEETAFLLDYLVGTPRPVVVTGAMRSAGSAGADGPANLLAAFRVAASPLAINLGTLVVFDDEIHAARFVRKTHSFSTGAFRSVNAGPIGWVVEGRVRIPLIPRRRAPTVSLASEVSELPPVALLRLCLGDDGTLLRYLSRADFAGAVVDVYGAGNASRQTIAPLRALASEMPVVLTSRTGAGELYQSTANFVGPERDLLDAGLISGVCLDGLKARLLLGLLLAAGADRSRIAESFAETAW